MNVDLRVVSRHLGLLLFVLSAFILAVSVFAGFDKVSIEAHQHTDFRALVNRTCNRSPSLWVDKSHATKQKRDSPLFLLDPVSSARTSIGLLRRRAGGH